MLVSLSNNEAWPRCSISNKQLWLLLGTCLCITSIDLEATKTLMIAVNLNDMVDVSNVIDPNNNKGALYDAVNAINTTIIDPLNRFGVESSQQSARYESIRFQRTPDLHMTLAYVGHIPANRESEYEAIVEDLKEELHIAIKKWLSERVDQSAMQCRVGTIIWPPKGHEGSWVSYGIQVRDDSQQDMLQLINTIQNTLSRLAQEWYGPFHDVRNNEQRLFLRKRSLEDAGLHVSVARFKIGYNVNKESQSVFGLPSSATNKKFIDDQFQALPRFKKSYFHATHCMLYMKDEHHHVQVLERFSLIRQREKPAEKITQ